MTHTVEVKAIEPVTHDTHHIVTTRPESYDWKPGQATMVAVDKEGWRDEKRPFSFTGPPEAERLEFIIKSYPERGGVTEQIGELAPGDRLLIGNPWGAIEDKGPGVFIAGGAGVTPFIGILRERARKASDIDGCTLIFSNKTERDIILREEWEDMDGLSLFLVLTQEGTEALPKDRIDKAYLEKVLKGWRENFYICGPPGMVKEVTGILRAEGVPDDKIIHEKMK
jgi:ferredoxin-NADP reductase